jgi:hypothetical protein
VRRLIDEVLADYSDRAVDGAGRPARRRLYPRAVYNTMAALGPRSGSSTTRRSRQSR